MLSQAWKCALIQLLVATSMSGTNAVLQKPRTQNSLPLYFQRCDKIALLLKLEPHRTLQLQQEAQELVLKEAQLLANYK